MKSPRSKTKTSAPLLPALPATYRKAPTTNPKMMKTPSSQSILPEAPPNVPKSWENLKDALNLQPHEVAYHLSASCGEVSSTQESEILALRATHANTMNATTFMAEAAASQTTRYFLVVTAGKVQVLYGMTNCYCAGVGGNGSRYFGLLGDYTRPSDTGPVIPPELYTLTGQPTTAAQAPSFGRVQVEAKSLEAIAAAFNVEDSPSLVPTLPPAAADSPNPSIRVWKALPVHPKTAVLFFRGVPAKEAFFQIRSYLSDMSPEERTRFTSLSDFIRASVTTNDLEPPTSIIETGWIRKDHGDPSSPDLRAWYHEKLQRSASNSTGAPPTPTNPRRSPERAGTPDSVDNFVRLLDSRFRNLPPSTPEGGTTSSTYNKYEMIVLCGICNIIGTPATWSDLTVDVLPPFWAQVRALRGRNSHLRTFVEGFIRDHANSEWQYHYLLTTEMLTIIRGLQFAADDPDRSWACRLKGMSLWSLAPQGESAHSEAARQRQQMLHYEETIDNHRPDDRAKSEQLLKAADDTPQGRFALFRWVDHAMTLLQIFFGDDCAAFTELKPLATLLQSPENFHNYRPINWTALAWRLHLGLRCFFQAKGQGPVAVATIQRITYDLSSGHKYGPDVLPLDHPHFSKTPPQGGGRGRQVDVDYTNPASRVEPPPTKRQKTPAKGSTMAPKFASLIQKASAAVDNKLRASMLWKTTDDIHKLLGPKFMELIPTGKQPCLKYHIFGACASPNCNFCHATSQSPSTEVVNGIAGRVKERVDAFVLNPKE